MAMQYGIEASQLTKRYGEKTVVSNLSFVVKKGEVFGLLGHNGAGKSTTIDCLLGLKVSDKGESKILGLNPKKKRKELFEKVGVQLQATSYQASIRVGELCEEMTALYKQPADYKKLLEQFKLDTFEKQPVDKLSGGERQKLSVLLALLSQPEVVFLDELTTGLDVAARREVWEILRGLKKQGLTIFLTSHYMDEVEALCDHICLIKKGQEVVSGTVQEVVAKSPCERLEEAYLWYMSEEVML